MREVDMSVPAHLRAEIVVRKLFLDFRIHDSYHTINDCQNVIGRPTRYVLSYRHKLNQYLTMGRKICLELLVPANVTAHFTEVSTFLQLHLDTDVTKHIHKPNNYGLIHHSRSQKPN
jgi:hypothetical protein